jgi:hypothetical protein
MKSGRRQCDKVSAQQVAGLNRHEAEKERVFRKGVANRPELDFRTTHREASRETTLQKLYDLFSEAETCQDGPIVKPP